MSTRQARRSGPGATRLVVLCALLGIMAGDGLVFAGRYADRILPALPGVLGLLAGLAVAAGLVRHRRRADTTIRSAADLTAMRAPTLMGSIPDVPATDGDDVLSPRAEAFRRLRTQLQYVDVVHPPQAVVVTSSLPGEGRTTVAVNLATTLARNGRKVVLIDADLRRPRVHSQLGMRGQRGLTSLLTGQAGLSEVLHELADGLQVLPAGPVPGNPSELLGSKNMLDLLQTLDKVFDHIIIDTPPLLSVTDAAVLSKMTNGVLVVVRAGAVHAEELTEALTLLEQVHSRVLGTVLTLAPPTGRTSRPAFEPDAVTLTVPARPTPPAPVPTVEYSVGDAVPDAEPSPPPGVPEQKVPEPVPVVSVTTLL